MVSGMQDSHVDDDQEGGEYIPEKKSNTMYESGSQIEKIQETGEFRNNSSSTDIFNLVLSPKTQKGKKMKNKL
jgi:hypothetical protein